MAGMPSCTACSALATMLSTDSRSTPGMEATGTRLLLALDDEQRPDQVVDAEAMLGDEAARPARATRPAQAHAGKGAERGRLRLLRSGASALRAEGLRCDTGWRGFIVGVRGEGIAHTHRNAAPLARAVHGRAT